MAAKLLYEDNYHRLQVRMDGADRSIRNPVAVYHKALMEYREDLDLEFIVLFEKLLVFYRTMRLRPFEYQQDRLSRELHIKRTRLEKARSKLVEAGILKENNPGKGKKIRYELNKNRIIEIVPYLYKMPADENQKAQTIKELQTFFEYYLNRKYLRAKVDPSIPDNIHIGAFPIFRPDEVSPDKNPSDEEENNTDGQS